MKKKKVLKVIGIILVILLIWIFFPTWTPKIKTANGISEFKKLEINGTELHVMIRGENKDNPVILYVHGGPCMPDSDVIRNYQDLLEKDFTIVNYDQRGAGKSYKFGEDYSYMTAQTHVDDIISMTKYIKEYLNKDKIILIGHSWGSYIGMQAATQNSEDYIAYIGIGQMSDTKQSETTTLNKIIAEAKKQGNQKDVDLLENSRKDVESGKTFVDRALVEKYGYGHGNLNTWIALKAELFGPEWNRLDLIKLMNGAKYQEKLLNEALQKPITSIVNTVKVPTYFIMGKYDGMTSPEDAKIYFDSLDGDVEREYILYDNSAHYPHFGEKEKFYEWMVEEFK